MLKNIPEDVTNFDWIQHFLFAFETCSYLRNSLTRMVTIPVKFQQNEATFYFKTFVF